MWPLAFLGLVFPFFVLINLVFVLFWLSQKKWYFIISLVILLIGIKPISRTYQLSGLDAQEQTRKGDPGELGGAEPGTAEPGTAEPGTAESGAADPGTAVSGAGDLKILSYNVRVFGLVGNARYGPEQDSIFSLIRRENPDVVCFQEFYVNSNKGLTLEKVESQLPGMPYHHVIWLTQGNDSKYGIATFSKYPMVKKGRVVLERTYNASIFSDLLIDKKRVRIFNNHLQSIRFNRRDYQFITNQNQYNDSEKLRALQDISFRLRDAFIKRSQQAREISKHVRRSSFPVLVCGDFNDTPVSYTYQTVRWRLKDAFVEAGSGMGITYKGRFPSFRIDYIFYEPTFRIRGFEVVQRQLSDHYPITATFRMP